MSRNAAGAGRPLVAVTGSGGRLGGHVVAALKDAGWRVRCLAHRRSAPGADEIVWGDLLEPASLRPFVEGAEGVVHLAATTHARDPSVYPRVNVVGTEHLLRTAELAGVARFVHVSSAAISRSGGAYSRSKADAEDLVAAATLETTILRLPDVLGVGGEEGLDALVQRARAGRTLLVVGSGSYEVRPVLVEDVAAVFPAALSAPAAAGGVYTLGGQAMTMRGFARACSDAFGGRSRLVSVPEAVVAAVSVAARFLPLPLYPDQLARLRAPRPAPSEAAATDLGFQPRPVLAHLLRSSAVERHR